jgi:hypothetical protein
VSSYGREVSIFEASTSSLHTLSIGTSEYYGSASNVNEESYFSPSEEFDHSANN